MEEQDWKNIIDELTEQIKQVSIERAVARADVKKALSIIKDRDKQIAELQAEIQELNSAEVKTVKAGK